LAPMSFPHTRRKRPAAYCVLSPKGFVSEAVLILIDVS
jgi:hypothetical protein